MRDGLPKMRDARPVDFVDTFLLGGIERMTHLVMTGEAVTAEALADIERIANRLAALRDAIQRRREMQEPR